MLPINIAAYQSPFAGQCSLEAIWKYLEVIWKLSDEKNPVVKIEKCIARPEEMPINKTFRDTFVSAFAFLCFHSIFSLIVDNSDISIYIILISLLVSYF